MPPTIRKGFDMAPHPLVVDVIAGLRTKERIHRDNRRLFASDVARCPRKAVIHHHIDPTLEVETAAAGKFYMGIGSVVHDKITDALYARNSLLFKEYRIHHLDLSLGGYVDAVALVNGKIRCVEIKTCGKLPDAPKGDHKFQATMYHAVTGIPATLLYVSRTVANFEGKLQIKAFDLEATREQLDAALASAAVAHYCSEAGVLPRIPAHLSEAECRYCPFATMCWGDAELPAPPLSDETMRVEIMGKVKAKVAELKANEANRFNGVLKHIQTHGTPHARTFLASADWASLV